MVSRFEKQEQDGGIRILIVNPNTTGSMTERIGEIARQAACPGTTITAVNPTHGPAAVEGFFDGALSVPGLLQQIARGENEKVDAHIVACFDDTGLDAARALAFAPVIGIGEAAFHLASLVGDRFSVVTTLSRSVATIEANLVRYGLVARCAGVHAANVPVLALDGPDVAVREKVELAVQQVLAADRSEAIVLGCAGMAGLAEELSKKFEVPVIDGVAAAVKMAEGLVSLGLRTSKIRAYAPPFPERLLALDEIGQSNLPSG